MFLYCSLFLFLATTYAVYIGGRTLNDHLVVVFVAGCMLPYVITGWIAEQNLFILGPLGIASLFAVLVRKKEASDWMMPFVVLSQPAYAMSFWWYGCLPFYLSRSWYRTGSIVPMLEWWIVPSILGVWGCIWTYLKREQVSTHILGTHGVRVVHISDIHASPVMREKELVALCHRVNDLNPDLVCLTGDLVMPFSEEDHSYMLRALAILRAPLYCCMGNHDLPIQDVLRDELSHQQSVMLINEQVELQVQDASIQIGGLQFYWSNGKERVESITSTFSSSGDVRIVLAHDPRYFQWIDETKFDLVLSGHTHGGQVASNMFGFAWSILRLLRLYDQGVFTKGRCSMYVHKGNWLWGLPPRMGVAPEIALFLL